MKKKSKSPRAGCPGTTRQTSPGKSAPSRRRTRWKAYDPETAFPTPADAGGPGQPFLYDGKKASYAYATKRVTAGTQMDVEIYPDFQRLPAWIHRPVDREAQRKAQKDLNERKSRQACARLINENFGPADYWLTLTYYDHCLPTDRAAAKRDFSNWMRRVNYRRRRAGLPPAKYVRVIEWSDRGKRVRCHIHVVIDGALPVKQLLALWPLGARAKPARLSKDENGLTGLALYITKPHAKLEDDTKFEKRWAASRNLRPPRERKNHKDFGPRTVEAMAQRPATLYDTMERKSPGYWCEQAEARWNSFVKLYYIRAAMREKARPGDLVTISGQHPRALESAMRVPDPAAADGTRITSLTEIDRRRLMALLGKAGMLQVVQICQQDAFDPLASAVLRPPGGQATVTVPLYACIIADKKGRIP